MKTSRPSGFLSESPTQALSSRRFENQFPRSQGSTPSIFGRVSAAYSLPQQTARSETSARKSVDFPISADAVLRHRRLSSPRFFRTVGPWLSYL